MQELNDNALLREYVRRDSEEAFAVLVTRHVNKVYSVSRCDTPATRIRLRKSPKLSSSFWPQSLAIWENVSSWKAGCTKPHDLWRLLLSTVKFGGAAANNGQNLTDPAQLLPYVTTPQERTALQKLIQGNGGR